MSEGRNTTFSRQQQLVMNNPFTVHNNDPKWPDGLASVSMGVKHYRITEVYGSSHIIVLFPGMLNWMTCHSYTGQENGSQAKFQMSAVHGIAKNEGDDLLKYYAAYTAGGDETDGGSNTGAAYLQEIRDKVVEWRPVSIGLRIYCCNNDRENDGFVECVRIPHGHLSEYFALIYKGKDSGGWATTNTNEQDLLGRMTEDYLRTNMMAGHIMVSDYWIKRITDATTKHPFRLANLPGYSLLNVSDLSDYQFVLNPSKHYNEFLAVKSYVDTNEVYYVERNHMVSWRAETNPPQYSSIFAAGQQATLRYEKFRLAQNQAKRAVEIDSERIFSSDSFDCIILRIHGTPKTRLLLHSSACMEYICTNNQQTGVTPTYADPGLIKRHIETRNAYHKYAYDSKALHPDTKY